VKVYILLFILIFIFVPKVVFGTVVINEIMYDLKKGEGSDTGREWIEVKNTGSEQVDLSTWKLYENKTNHALNLFSGNDAFIASGGYAVIADNAEKFLIDWPGFSGVVFDSSFSLKQSGETLILRDEALNDIDQVDYLPEWGAGGDGDSLQLVNGKWIAGAPTPGSSNASDAVVVIPSEDPQVLVQVPSPNSINPLPFPTAPQIYAFSGGDKVGIVGGIVSFEGEALGLKKEPLSNARFVWNFGDGSSKEGKNVTHVYNYPGDYAVFLDVSSSEYSATSRIDVKITEAKLTISNVEINPDGELLIELHNNSGEETNISYWLLESGNVFFAFPKNSIIKATSSLNLPFSVTSLKIDYSKKVNLLYPNGPIFYSFDTNFSVVKSNPLEVYKADILSPKPETVDTSKNNKVALKVTPKSDIVVSKVLPQNNIVSQGNGKEASIISFSGKDKKSNKWIFFIVGFSVVGVLGVVLMRRFSESA